MLISKAAAKLILAGEHGVLYGVSAITTSIYWYTTCHWQESNTPCLSLNGHTYHYTQQSLAAHWQSLCARQALWQTQPDTQILQAEADLALLVLAWWQRHYPLAALTCQIDSEIPIGSGLGSSASVIIALLRGLANWHGIALSSADYQQMATELEGFAHGKSSGLDVKAILADTCTYWQAQGSEQALPEARLTGYLVNTGQPQSSTSACVRHVRQHHAQDHSLWQAMQQAVDALSLALATQTNGALSAVHQLQRCLTQLGIVPKQVQAFTAEVESRGGAGKLCGAGSIAGDGGGFYWLLTHEDPRDLCEAFQYPYWALDHVSKKTHSEH
jgi:mevalonate kinase